MRKFIEGSVTISKTYAGDDQHMSIEVMDEASRKRFINVKVSIKDMMEALTGLCNVPATFHLSGTDVVGKKKETKVLVFEIPDFHSRDYAEEKAQSFADEGWTAKIYFGSQMSFFGKGDKYFASTSQFRYVEIE